MADDTTPPFTYRNPDGNGSVRCGWTKQGQLYLRPEHVNYGSAAIVARDQAWELAKYIARDLPGGLVAALDNDAKDALVAAEQDAHYYEREMEKITAENVALVNQRDEMMAEIIALKARLMPHVAEPEPLTEEEVW